MSSGRERMRRIALGGILVLGTGPVAAAGAGSRAPGLWSEPAPRGVRFGLAAEGAAVANLEGPGVADPGAEGDAGASLSPPLAGFLSLMVPGSAQLVMGQRRGWFYLGVETVAWFSYFALRSAGNQAEEDYREFADAHWTWERYVTVTECERGGPENFEEERDALEELYANDRDQFYEDIGDQDVYACGWESDGVRRDFLGQIDDADALFRGSGIAVGVVFLNHLVSAIDAARSAAGRRREDVGSLRWEMHPGPAGPEVAVVMRRSF